jgi:hypothetical protein
VGPGHDTGRTDARDGGHDVPSGACDAAGCGALCASAGFPSGSCTETGACTCSGGDAGTPGSAGEICGDGLDNNDNGAVDEGCGCDIGTTQPCYLGSRETRHIGACQDGTQPCNAAGEFSHWGECTGYVLPSDEFCGDGIDNDCDGFTDEDCGSPCAPIEFGRVNCADGLDNDCDGRTDCADLQCLPFCCTTEICGDALDNDCDGYTDCTDSDCCSEAACASSTICGAICCAPGASRYCDTPTYCSWGIQDCRPDGHWGTCDETTTRPPGCDDGSYYYSASCCMSAGACCQNYGRYDSSLPPEASIGNCGDTTCPTS